MTESSDSLGLFGSHDPDEYMIPECDVDLDGELLPDGNSFSRAQRRRAEHVFERACALADTYEAEIELVVKSGDAVEAITTYAAEQTVDHIVIAAHRRTELRPLLRGVPEAVARHASPPVAILG